MTLVLLNPEGGVCPISVTATTRKRYLPALVGSGQLSCFAVASNDLIVQIRFPLASITRYWVTTADVVPARVVKRIVFLVSRGGLI